MEVGGRSERNGKVRHLTGKTLRDESGAQGRVE